MEERCREDAIERRRLERELLDHGDDDAWPRSRAAELAPRSARHLGVSVQSERPASGGSSAYQLQEGPGSASKIQDSPSDAKAGL
jgi:hypothetical protein